MAYSHEDLLTVAYESAKGRTALSREQFVFLTRDWTAVPVEVQDKLVGAILMNGPEIHACVLPEAHGRWYSRKLVREVLLPLIQQYGYAESRADTEAGKQFLIRLGFVQLGDTWVLKPQSL